MIKVMRAPNQFLFKQSIILLCQMIKVDKHYSQLKDMINFLSNVVELKGHLDHGTHRLC